MSSLGNRMFRLDLGDIALSYLGRTSLEDIAKARKIKKEHPTEFGAHWLTYTGLDELHDVWVKVNNDLLGGNDER